MTDERREAEKPEEPKPAAKSPERDASERVELSPDDLPPSENLRTPSPVENGAPTPASQTVGSASNNDAIPKPVDPAPNTASPILPTTEAASQTNKSGWVKPAVGKGNTTDDTSKATASIKPSAHRGANSVQPQPVPSTTPFQNTQANTPEDEERLVALPAIARPLANAPEDVRLVALPAIARPLMPSEIQQNSAILPERTANRGQQQNERQTPAAQRLPVTPTADLIKNRADASTPTSENLQKLVEKLDQAKEKQRLASEAVNQFIPKKVAELKETIRTLKKEHGEATQEFGLMDKGHADYAKTEADLTVKALKISQLETQLTTANTKLVEKKAELDNANSEVKKIQSELNATRPGSDPNKQPEPIVLKQEEFVPSSIDVIDFKKKKENRSIDYSKLQPPRELPGWTAQPPRTKPDEAPPKLPEEKNLMATLSKEGMADKLNLVVTKKESDCVHVALKGKNEGTLKVTSSGVTSKSDDPEVWDKQAELLAKLLMAQGRLETATVEATGPQKQYLEKKFAEIKKQLLNPKAEESQINVAKEKPGVSGEVGRKDPEPDPAERIPVRPSRTP